MTTATATATNRPLNVGLWVAQILLAFAFGMAGMFKLGTPVDELLANGMTFVTRVPSWLVLFIGASELLGAIGLILPSALRILPRLTVAAAGGLVVVMILAAAEHAMAGELASVPVNAVLGGLAAFVAWGRTGPAPIPPR